MSTERNMDDFVDEVAMMENDDQAADIESATSPSRFSNQHMDVN